MIRKDLTGMIFNSWEVLSIAECGKNKTTKYKCKCLECGREYVLSGYSVKTGASKMCRSCSAKKCQHHKYTGDNIVSVFSGMWQRCYDCNQVGYKNYGARGITICEEWLNNREAFYDWAYENGYKEGMSIERKDVNKGYSPDNCTFIPLSEQSKNRRNIHMITIDGVTKCLSEWCRFYNISNTHTVLKYYRSNGNDWISAIQSASTNH